MSSSTLAKPSESVEERVLRLLGHAADVTARNTDRLHTWGTFMNSPLVSSTGSYEHDLLVDVEDEIFLDNASVSEGRSEEDIRSLDSNAAENSVHDRGFQSGSPHGLHVGVRGDKPVDFDARAGPSRKRPRTQSPIHLQLINSNPDSHGVSHTGACDGVIVQDCPCCSIASRNCESGSRRMSVNSDGSSLNSEGDSSSASSGSSANDGSSASVGNSESDGSGASGLRRMRQQIHDCRRDMERQQQLYRDASCGDNRLSDLVSKSSSRICSSGSINPDANRMQHESSRRSKASEPDLPQRLSDEVDQPPDGFASNP